MATVTKCVFGFKLLCYLGKSCFTSLSMRERKREAESIFHPFFSKKDSSIQRSALWSNPYKQNLLKVKAKKLVPLSLTHTQDFIKIFTSLELTLDSLQSQSRTSKERLQNVSLPPPPPNIPDFKFLPHQKWGGGTAQANIWKYLHCETHSMK